MSDSDSVGVLYILVPQARGAGVHCILATGSAHVMTLAWTGFPAGLHAAIVFINVTNDPLLRLNKARTPLACQLSLVDPLHSITASSFI